MTTHIGLIGLGKMGGNMRTRLENAGIGVTGYDTNDDFVVRVNTTGTVDFQEEGLTALLRRHLHGRLTLTSTPPTKSEHRS